ncbi:ribonuclease III [Nostoc sp. 'Peltigera membranacea cyanobiont' N6]|uniref:ribonuclease III n=1 Tax=Nostoc sp. 'Peltigera membranacea cyanobiont' N6 TaxID=1261031 RepID=UPI000D0C046A|nr:ribonuclease III [Nostoc sp. 'Peltigera membranacea cyanobiont' N6]AVH65111.1 ribonuclease III [Nostoc sp. 'Peltigera membranacea cyanobiont' N6]
MAISNRNRIETALIYLNQGLHPYVEQEMRKVHGEGWLKIAISCLSDNQSLKRNPEDILHDDISELLKVIIGQWNQVFKRKLGHGERALVSEIIEVRNKWAHEINGKRFSTDDTYRALDSIARLLKAISASEADIVEKHKQEVLRALSPKQAEEVRIRESLDELLKQLPFQDASLLLRALTHTSYMHENPNSGEDNERLEFLGDALLNFLSGEYLYRHYPDKKEGELTPLRSRLVDKPQLAKFAVSLDLGKWVRLGNGAEKDGGRTQSRLLSNTFEAIIGAYFLDSGTESVRDFVEPLFDSVIAENLSISHKSDSNSNNFVVVDSKNRFQEWVQHNVTPTPPKYVTVQTGGLSHTPEFLAKVLVGEEEFGEGKGRNKKDAEKAAAEDALANLKKQGLL